MHLYQCWFSFTQRSPIKNFASCRLREKNFASLRLRKNLVELRARLSLLVDKTIFQYRALTIYYTTIDWHAPSCSQRPPPCRTEGDTMDAPVSLPAPTPQGKDGTPWTCRITPVPAAASDGRGGPGRSGSHQHAPAPPAADGKKGTLLTRPDQPHH